MNSDGAALDRPGPARDAPAGPGTARGAAHVAGSVGAARQLGLWLTLPIAVVLAAVSLAGLSQPDLYRGAPAWTIQAVAQDAVDLILVLPLLVLSAVLAARGSWRFYLVWLGALSYLAYTFAIYAFAVAHTTWFLAYVALLGLSTWTLAWGLATTKWRALGERFADRAPARWVGLYLAVPAALFYLLWLADELPALRSGELPASLVGLGLATNPVHVLDLALLLPAMLLAGLALLRGRRPAYGLAELLLVNGLLQNLAIAAMMIVALGAGQAGSPVLVAVFLGLAALNGGLQVWFLQVPAAPGTAPSES